jgi:hypothetical protein
VDFRSTLLPHTLVPLFDVVPVSRCSLSTPEDTKFLGVIGDEILSLNFPEAGSELQRFETAITGAGSMSYAEEDMQLDYLKRNTIFKDQNVWGQAAGKAAGFGNNFWDTNMVATAADSSW